MALTKITTQSNNVVWSRFLRPKVNSTVIHNGVEYSSLTGVNSEPSEESTDWKSLSGKANGGEDQDETTLPLVETDYGDTFPLSVISESLVASNVSLNLNSALIDLGNTDVNQVISNINRPSEEVLRVRLVNTVTGAIGYSYFNQNYFSDLNDHDLLFLESLNSNSSSYYYYYSSGVQGLSLIHI